MQAYLIRRLLLMIPTLIVTTLIVFFVVRLVPGSIIDLMVSDMEFTTQMDRDAIQHALGLDKPIYTQYVRWVWQIISQGSLGKSLWKNVPVTQEILARIPVTLELGVLSLIVGLIISIPIGVYSAMRQDTVGDYIARSFAILLIALPGFWVGTMVVVFPALWWKWSPPMIYISLTEDPIGNFKQVIVPAIILGMAMSGVTMRMMRTMMLEVLRQDYIRTAWAKGLEEKTVIRKHALKNALIPVVTIVGLWMPIVVEGAVILEQIFNLPGIGRLLIESAFTRDYSIVSGLVLLIACGILVINLFIDLIYGFLDPRVRFD
ncbi:MAG: ABC transporter permease [Deltaproteobacteria bacterium]|nr:ABC transporter permease [Deltaproteobacteria bacterium]MBW2085035.1 ABC transporter permease [Deltaproteobacteria bacterium]